MLKVIKYSESGDEMGCKKNIKKKSALGIVTGKTKIKKKSLLGIIGRAGK